MRLSFAPVFCLAGINPYSTVQWVERSASVTAEDGGTLFEQRDVRTPAEWSDMAVNVVVSKYFRGHPGTPERETGVDTLIHRVVDTITEWGVADGYFSTDADAEAFSADLAWLCLHQHLAFNSPVWFNVGAEEKPQCSACFINSVEDTMESILGLARTEGMLFKWGSGAGSNLSPIRSSKERLRGGGTASGPVSFMRGFDSFAGVIKSGGKTRRAAKMVILDIGHPDVVDFIRCKEGEEEKAHVLIDAGYDGGFNVPGGAYDSVFFQNANHSVRVTGEFMLAVEADGDWSTRAVTTGEVLGTYKARRLMSLMSEAAWKCGDPGVQFDTTINAWHTCPNTDRIYASNPCSEYMFLNDTACNLASLNLMRFRESDGSFNVDRFTSAVRIAITAQEILVGRAAYPTPTIEKNSHDYRPLGLGYANLGALLMADGRPYDSQEAQSLAAAITSLMTATAYHQSAVIASACGPFAGFEANREPMLAVVGKHIDATTSLYHSLRAESAAVAITEKAVSVWAKALQFGRAHGYRHSQVTVLAPTGTIGFMLDCATTGIEPDIALIKYKKMVGGGYMKIVNQTVGVALERLGYSPAEREVILAHLAQKETIEGAPGLKPEDLPVFDCAFKPANGERSLSPMSHIRMMAAVQPFLSGAISKTVNVPGAATAEDIGQLYMEAWKAGLKSVAIYRDGCKRTQPLNTARSASKAEPKPEAPAARRRLPSTRHSLTHKFEIAGHEGYVTVGLYDDGAPGEIFVRMAKEGSTLSGLLDDAATSMSLALQYGVPLHVLTSKKIGSRFEPSGFTGNPDIPFALSIVDYIGRWLDLTFGEGARPEPYPAPAPVVTAKAPAIDASGPPCADCGSLTVRSGSCYRCTNCGSSTGCGG